MNSMLTRSIRCFHSLIALAAVVPGVFAAEALTDPVGVLHFTAPAGSDTCISLPLHRELVFEGAVVSVAGEVVTFDLGSDSWTAGQFVGADSYYMLVCSGTLEGASFTITANGSDTLTLGGSPLTGLAAGDTVRVIPHMTLASLFSNQGTIAGTADITGAGAPIQIIVVYSKPGSPLPRQSNYFYYSGTTSGGPGWRLRGGVSTEIHDDDVIPPGAMLIFRNASQAASDLYLVGNVQMAAHRTVIQTAIPGLRQDIPVGTSAASSLTLAQSQLFETGAIAGTLALDGAGADMVLVYNNAATGFNKQPSACYYYYTGTASGGAGWRKAGDAAATLHNDTIVFKAGQGFVIRKAGTASGNAVIWSFVPPYLE